MDRPLVVGLTYSAHPVSCAAGLANLQIMQEEGMVENAARMGRYVEYKVAELAAKHPSIGDFRNTGLLGCIELVKDRASKEPLVEWNTVSRITGEIAGKIRELGMFTFVKWNFIFIAPPLNITEAEVDEGMAILSKAIELADGYYTGK